jgi:hypothetical protein
VLFYVYPLKFLTKLILVPVAYLFNQHEMLVELSQLFEGANMAYLMVIYGIGATSVFAVLMLMYRYALKNATLLQLNEIEIFDTRASMQANFLMGSIPFISVVMALALRNQLLGGMYSGFAYFLYFPVMFLFGKQTEKRRKKLLVSVAA